MEKQRLEELLNFVPLEGKCNMGSLEAVGRRDCSSFAVASDLIQQNVMSSPTENSCNGERRCTSYRTGFKSACGSYAQSCNLPCLV